ncbi:MAG: glycine zipper 2TM domain-containing protein [Gammaproteobacteria bacterium]
MANLNRTARTRSVFAVCMLGTTLLAFPLAGTADDWRRDSNAYYDYAKVTHVEPITRIVQISSPREVCWNERVRTVRDRGYRRDRSFTPTVIGGLLGGVVGNQFGRGRGNTAMTVAGALLGASIGRDASSRQYHRPRPATVDYSTERRCEVEQVVHEEERVDGYRVEYRFRGRKYVTRTDTDPGRRIRVRVEVDPVPAI